MIEAPKTARLASIDIFRGLTMMVMIFVNDLESVHGMPWWTRHMAADINAMTYVDMVFPFFLFIIGLSIPIAMRHRLKKNPSITALWLHVLLRAGSLITLGLILANVDRGSRKLIGFNPNLWALLALGGAALFLSVIDPRSRYAKLHRWLQVFGVSLTIAMFALFRSATPDGTVSWIDGSYPEILGLIGYTYLAIAILYIPTRRWLWAPLVSFAVLLSLSVSCAAGWIDFPHHVSLYFWPFGDGTMAFVTMAGVVTSYIFVGERKWQTLRNKLLLSGVFAASMLVAGWAFTPLGISKIRDTPTWGLYSAAAATAFFAALYWLCDVKRQTNWAMFVRPAGGNTLLTYLLPDFYYFASWMVGFTYLETHLNYGWAGVTRSVVFTGTILAVARLLTRWKVRLQL